MPGVKMLRQNFVSASNKSPKDKRLRPLKIFPIFFQVFSKRVFVYITKEGAGFLPDDTLSHVKKTNLLSRCNRCTTLSNLKRKKREMNNQIHLHFLLKQPLCESSFHTKQTRQSKQCGFSIYIFDNSKSKSMVRLIRSEKMGLSGLVFARKIARMILIQNIQGLMINMAFMPLYM